MKIPDFPRDEGMTESEKLTRLYSWCYALNLYLKGGMKNGKISSGGEEK